MPLTTALIGERVEVCFGTEYDDGNGETYNGLFWFGGEIIKLGGREHGGGQKGTIVIKFDDGTTDSLLANRPTLWEVEQAGAWCFERPNDDDDDGEEPVEDEPEPVAADAEDEEDACGDDEMVRSAARRGADRTARARCVCKSSQQHDHYTYRRTTISARSRPRRAANGVHAPHFLTYF